MIIKTADVTRVYQMGAAEVHALRGVDLQVERGEFVAIMGTSGSGKSTLLHLLGCLDRPTAGRYWLDGEAVETLGDQALSRIRNRKIGFVFQAFNLISQHTVLQNVELPLVYGGVPPRLRSERSRVVLENVGLVDKAVHRATELSGGEAQRVAIARALAVDPVLLLADEPTGNLDSGTGRGIMSLFKDLNERGATVVVVTHSAEVAGYARRVIEMKDGVVVRDACGAAAHARWAPRHNGGDLV